MSVHPRYRLHHAVITTTVKLQLKMLGQSFKWKGQPIYKGLQNIFFSYQLSKINDCGQCNALSLETN